MPFSIPILSSLTDLGKTWIEGRQKVSQAAADAKATVMTTAAQSTADWTALMAKASNNSWKDEWFSIVLSIPLIMCFVPDAQQYVHDGFIYLSNNTPDWYQNLLYIAVTASFGVRAGGKYSDHLLQRKAIDAKNPSE